MMADMMFEAQHVETGSCLRDFLDRFSETVFAHESCNTVFKMRNLRGMFDIINVLETLRNSKVMINDVAIFSTAGSMYGYVQVAGLDQSVMKKMLKGKGGKRRLSEILLQQEASWDDLQAAGFEEDEIVPFTLH